MKQRNNSAFCNLHFAFHRLVAMALVLALIVGMVPAVGATDGAAEFDASVTIDGESTNYTELQDAVDAASAATGEKVTLTLLRSVTTDAMIHINGGKFTIDLAGQHLTNSANRVLNINEGEITLEDSVGGGTVETTASLYQAIWNNDTLVINGGTVKGPAAAVGSAGSLTMNGGTLISEISGLVNHGTATINGGTLTGNGEYGIVNHGSLTVYDAKVSGGSAVADLGTALLLGGSFTGTGYAALTVYGGTTTVTGGSFTGKDDAYGRSTGVPNGEWTVECEDEGVLLLQGGEFPNGFVAETGFSANSYLAEGYCFCKENGVKLIVTEDANRIDRAVKVLHGDDALEPQAHSVTVAESEHGTVTADKSTAFEGDTVTVTITPDEGYIVDSWSVTAEDGSTVETKDGYKFVMPDCAVTVTVEYVRGYLLNLQIKTVDSDGNEIPYETAEILYYAIGAMLIQNSTPVKWKLTVGEHDLVLYHRSNPEYIPPESLKMTVGEDGTVTSNSENMTVETDGEVIYLVIPLEESGYKRVRLTDENGEDIWYMVPDRNYTAVSENGEGYTVAWYPADYNYGYMEIALGTDWTFSIDTAAYEEYQQLFLDSGYEFNSIYMRITKDGELIETRWVYLFDSDRVRVTFRDHDGTVLKDEIIKPGESATAPEVPEREGYTFSGWDKAFDNVTEDIVVTAQYKSSALVTVTSTSATGEKTITNGDTVRTWDTLTVSPADGTTEYWYDWFLNDEYGASGEEYTIPQFAYGDTLTLYVYDNANDYFETAIENAVCSMSMTVGGYDVTLETVDGAQIRTTGKQGLRFTSTILKTGDWEDVVEYGTVILPSSYADDDQNNVKVGATIDGYAVAKVPAVNKYAEDDTSVTFTAVITDIAEKNYQRTYLARAYAIMKDGSVVYGDTYTVRSIHQIAKLIAADENAAEADKAAAQEIIDVVTPQDLAFTVTDEDGNVITDTAAVGTKFTVTHNNEGITYYYDWFLDGEYYAAGNVVADHAGEWTLYVYDNMYDFTMTRTENAIRTMTITVE